MNYCKKYTALFLLLVFAWVLMPPAFIHNAFADHHDTVCDFKHHQEITTVEATHIHCDIFTTNTPLYYPPRLVTVVNPEPVIIAELTSGVQLSYFLFEQITLPARAPPCV